MFNPKKSLISAVSLLTILLAMQTTIADEVAKSRADLREPIYRVTKQDKPLTTKTAATAFLTAPKSKLQPILPEASVVQPTAKVEQQVEAHPLDTPLGMATEALQKSRETINDYTAVLVKRERVSGHLNDEQYMFVKIRNEKLDAANQVVTPFSVYLKFLKPSAVKGREVIYVKGDNHGKLIAHEGGLKGRFTPSLHLDPNGALAMMGQRYPATEIGLEKLCVKLLERGGRDRKLGCDCIVTEQPANINNRPATRIEVAHQDRKPHLDFQIARIYVDDEYGIPVRYEAFDWPKTPGGQVSDAELIEEYTYVRLKFNVGLTDLDFNPANPKYNMK